MNNLYYPFNAYSFRMLESVCWIYNDSELSEQLQITYNLGAPGIVGSYITNVICIFSHTKFIWSIKAAAKLNMN